MSILVNTSRTLLDWLIPPSCLLCDGQGENNLCEPCRHDLPWLRTQCSTCALPLEIENGQGDINVCAHCLEKPPSFDCCISPFRFADPVGPLINQFKLHHNLRYGSVLSAALTDSVKTVYRDCSKPQAIVPIPLHWRRILRRGFNQATYISQQISQQMDIPVRPLLLRQVSTPKQQGLNRKQRLNNLQHAFVFKANSIKENDTLPNHVALVDDVMTTGATAEAASQVLKQAGVKTVSVWVLARTPSPQ